MHDFYLTIPYGLLLALGGVIGYVKKGSTASLAAGAGTGLLLLLAGFLSVRALNHRTNSYFALILQTGIAALLTWVMGHRYARTGKFMPAGIVAALSFIMTGFYVYKVAAGGNHIAGKTV